VHDVSHARAWRRSAQGGALERYKLAPGLTPRGEFAMSSGRGDEVDDVLLMLSGYRADRRRLRAPPHLGRRRQPARISSTLAWLPCLSMDGRSALIARIVPSDAQ